MRGGEPDILGLGIGFTMGRGGGGEPDFAKARGATVVYENRIRKEERKKKNKIKKQGDCTYMNPFCCISD